VPVSEACYPQAILHSHTSGGSGGRLQRMVGGRWPEAAGCNATRLHHPTRLHLNHPVCLMMVNGQLGQPPPSHRTACGTLQVPCPQHCLTCIAHPQIAGTPTLESCPWLLQAASTLCRLMPLFPPTRPMLANGCKCASESVAVVLACPSARHSSAPPPAALPARPLTGTLL
jgi:hypothetical protein